MSDYRWQRRESKLKARRERMEEHGAAYKKLILPRIAARARAAQAAKAQREASLPPGRRDARRSPPGRE